MDLDYILPFAGIPENGREIDGLDDKSELAHRMMLVNLLRILGAVKNKKASRHFVTRPTQDILPLSPNHGLFGNDGLYSESKISLETLFGWCSHWVSVVVGSRHFTNDFQVGLAELALWHVNMVLCPRDTAFNILGLMHPLLFSITQVEPIWAVVWIRTVAGQISAGWEAGRYGIPEDIIADRPCSLGIELYSYY
jgi:fatty acid synthase subunit alpha